MKKLIKWVVIVASTVLTLLLIGIIALPFVFPLEKIKDFAAAKISETINREVKIEKVSLDIFSGIKLEKLQVGNRPGFAKKPFVSADSLELRYAFWPLFKKQIIIHEIRLVRPEILIEKNVRGEFNFSDLLQPKATEKPAITSSRLPEKTRNRNVQSQVSAKTKPPFDLLITSFCLKDGKILYADYSTETENEIKNLNVSVSGFALALFKPIEIKASADITYQGKEIPLSLSGKVGVNLERETISIPALSFSIAGEKASAFAVVSNWKKAPHIDFSLSSKKLSLDPLLAIFAAPTRVEKPKPRPGELTKTINSAVAAIPRNLGLSAKINVENLTFQKFKVDKINASLALAGKKITADLREIKVYDGKLSGKLTADLTVPGLAYEVKDLRLVDFNASPFSDAVIETFLTKLPDYKDLTKKIYGTLDVSASLKGRGVEPQDILANVSGSASLTLKNGEIKRLKTLAEVGKIIKSTTLQEDIKFGSLNAEGGLSKKVVNVKNLKLEEADFKLHFKGGIDLNKLVWVSGNRLTLKLAPALTKDLPKEFSIFKDDQGWLELAFELTGSLKMPFPKPILEKPMEVALGKIKAKIEAKKVEIEEKVKAEIATREAEVKEEVEQKIEAEKKRLEEEAKKKVKELLKF